MESRHLYIVEWREVRASTQAEKDFLYFYSKSNDDGSYLLDEDLLEELETALADDPPKEKDKLEIYRSFIKNLHALFEKEGEVSIIIS